MTYYTRGFTGTEHGLIKVEQFNALDEKVASGFDRLVDEADLKTDTMTSAVATVAANTGTAITYRATMPYKVTWPSRLDPDGPEVLRDQLRISLRFPVTNPGPALLDLLGLDGQSIVGAKPIRQVDGEPLQNGHIAPNAEAILAYADVESGYWTLMAAGRGEKGDMGDQGLRGAYDVDIYQNGSDTPATPTGGTITTDSGAVSPPTGWTLGPTTAPDGQKTYFARARVIPAGETAPITPIWSPPNPVGVPGPRGENLTIEAFDDLTFAASLEWNVGTHPNAVLELTGDVTGITLRNAEDGGVYTMLIRQDSTGGHSMAFPTAWNGPRGALATSANDETLLTIRRIGNAYYAAPLLTDLP